ncbi:MAG: SDR family NAD(P)-dependent oxidoreductase, partial [Pseudomonadota bacterium]|nr:SDR family NAD(P)-dependent oxidoreductase [Pseudomonadota bacterium]
MARTIFIFGLGYVGRPLGHRLAAAGWQIRGTTRTPERLAAEADAGWQIYRFADDLPLADAAAALDGVDAVLSTITAIGGSDPVLDAHGDVLADFRGWSGYVSATSVYPDRPDGFCYEDTPTDPATARGRARVVAEDRWLSLLQSEIFRAAGIYGPGRSPFDALRAGTARIIEHRGQVFNRIHVDDICRIIEAAIESPRRGRIINLADTTPAPQGDVVRHAAGLIGVEPPQPQSLNEANLSPMARSFY